ncbi:MAG: hypothetical protein Q9214_001865, partial [Letrouitia sp. 1 TL-2023]
MSSVALLDQDLGSDSEDDNFNPPPADDSDNEDPGDSEPEISKSTVAGRPQPLLDADSIKDENDEEEGQSKISGEVNKNSDDRRRRGRIEDDGEDGEDDVTHTNGIDEDEEDEDSDEDDDE